MSVCMREYGGRGGGRSGVLLQLRQEWRERARVRARIRDAEWSGQHWGAAADRLQCNVRQSLAAEAGQGPEKGEATVVTSGGCGGEKVGCGAVGEWGSLPLLNKGIVVGKSCELFVTLVLQTTTITGGPDLSAYWPPRWQGWGRGLTCPLRLPANGSNGKEIKSPQACLG